MKIIVNSKEIRANEEKYNVIPDMFGNGSVAFLADIPKGSIVTGVFVNGKSLEDYRINVEGTSTIYPRNEKFEGQKVVAILTSEHCDGELYSLAVAYLIESFIVEYIETAVAEV